jgi:mannose-1-phosphate guanylyltransferase
MPEVHLTPARLWSIVLAGGSGTRLADASRRLYGYPRPKQFCDFDGRGTLLQQTIARARRLVPEERVVVVTTRACRAEALESLALTPSVVHIEQPRGRDTGPGLLLPLLHVLRSDPDALVVVLPSDHHVSDADGFAAAVARAAEVVQREHPGAVVLLGAVPDRLEDGYGWIEPDEANRRKVAAFREKPPETLAQELLSRGALVNTFVMVGAVRTFSRLYARWAPRWWSALLRPGEVEHAYEVLPPSNFSTEVLERAVEQLRVMPLGEVGWTDVGTPERLQRTLQAAGGPR